MAHDTGAPEWAATPFQRQIEVVDLSRPDLNRATDELYDDLKDTIAEWRSRHEMLRAYEILAILCWVFKHSSSRFQAVTGAEYLPPSTLT